MALVLQTPRCLLPNLAALDIIGERRRLLADDSHRVQRRCIHQLLNRPRSPRQQAAHVPGLLLVRFVLHHLEQQRHLKFVMSRRRGRRRPVPMHHQRVLGVQSSSSTAGRQNVGGGAHAENIYLVAISSPGLKELRQQAKHTRAGCGSAEHTATQERVERQRVSTRMGAMSSGVVQACAPHGTQGGSVEVATRCLVLAALLIDESSGSC